MMFSLSSICVTETEVITFLYYSHLFHRRKSEYSICNSEVFEEYAFEFIGSCFGPNEESYCVQYPRLLHAYAKFCVPGSKCG